MGMQGGPHPVMPPSQQKDCRQKRDRGGLEVLSGEIRPAIGGGICCLLAANLRTALVVGKILGLGYHPQHVQIIWQAQKS